MFLYLKWSLYSFSLETLSLQELEIGLKQLLLFSMAYDCFNIISSFLISIMTFDWLDVQDLWEQTYEAVAFEKILIRPVFLTLKAFLRALA